MNNRDFRHQLRRRRGGDGGAGVSAIEKRRCELLFLLDCLRRDVRDRRFTQDGEHRLLWHMHLATQELEAAIAEAKNGSINAAKTAEQGK
jgi:hypothetical protein